MHKTGLTTHLNVTGGDASLTEERQTFTRDGEKVPGFTSSVVPTLEEKMLIKQQNGDIEGHGELLTPIQESQDTQGGSSAASERTSTDGDTKVDGVPFGQPANGAPNDAKPPKQGKGGDTDEEENQAPGARTQLRKHLTSKLGGRPNGKTWTLPTPTPHVDPHGFEDPISEEFWHGVWVSCAVHNVCIIRLCLGEVRLADVDMSRPRFSARSSTLFLMI